MNALSRFKWNMCNLFITVEIEYDKWYLRHLKATVHNGSLHLMMELWMIRHVHAGVSVEHVLKMLLMEIVRGWIEQHLWATNCFIGWWWLTRARCTTKNKWIIFKTHSHENPVHLRFFCWTKNNFPNILIVALSCWTLCCFIYTLNIVFTMFVKAIEWNQATFYHFTIQ